MEKLLNDAGMIAKTFLDGFIAFISIDEPLLNVATGLGILGLIIGIYNKWFR